MTTLSSMSAAQISRAKSLPRQIIAPNPVREMLLEAPRQRNALLDGFFYDIGILEQNEAAMLAPRYAREGAILAVTPSSRPSVKIWGDVATFEGDNEDDFAALVVAGVGSSALGAAAFARNVADAMDAPVLAVVSGYGLADLMIEAMGGFFLFGYLNTLRHVFEPLDTTTRPGMYSTGTSGRIADNVRRSLDVRSLLGLLSGPRRFDKLIGHSKGNLVISEALYELAELHPDRLRERGEATHVVTISTRIAMPREMQRVTDILGEIDGFGLLNSRVSIPTDIRVPKAWHHTNTEIPYHLPVTQTLRDLFALQN